VREIVKCIRRGDPIPPRRGGGGVGGISAIVDPLYISQERLKVETRKFVLRELIKSTQK